MNQKRRSTIMVVDDSPLNLQLLDSILEQNDYVPSIFLNGQDALDSLKDELPDLILLDIMMPDMDGLEVCKKLKENNGSKNIPVIFLTAKSKTEDIVKGFEYGAVDYVTKPFSPPELLARVKAHVETQILRGLIPICAKCHMLRNENGTWERVDTFLAKYANIALTHGICQECSDELYGDEEWYKGLGKEGH